AHGAQNNSVCERKRFGERAFKCIAAHGVGARLESSPQTAAGPASACRFDRCANCCWVMREIVDDEYATCFALDLKAAADPAKCLQSFFDGRARHFSSKGDGCGGKSIQYIVPPRERKANLCHFLAEMRDAKFHAAVNVGDVAGDPGCCPVQAVRFDR